MSPAAGEAKLRLSVLDRLVDDAPRSPLDATGGWEVSLSEMHGRLLRDLEWILNTRRIVDAVPEVYPELRRSVYNYGLPDLTSMPDTDESRDRLARSVEECIELFEPRLMAVRVTPSEVSDGAGRSLRLTIEGMLRVDPSPERIVFDTVVETVSGKVVVTGATDA